MAHNNKKMSYSKYLDRYQQRDKEPKKYYKYMDKFNSNNKKRSNGMANYNNKMKKKNNKKSGMIAKDYNAPANLPQGEKHVMYEKPYYMNGEMYNITDSLKAQDEQIKTDVRKLYKDKGNKEYPEKY